MWKVVMFFASYSLVLTPPMTEDDAYIILETLRKYPEPGVTYGLEEN